MTADENRSLAELSYRIRRFLRDDSVARAAGPEPQQYLMLLAICGLPLRELRSNGHRLVHAINQLVEYRRQPRNGNRHRKSPGRRERHQSE